MLANMPMMESWMFRSQMEALEEPYFRTISKYTPTMRFHGAYYQVLKYSRRLVVVEVVVVALVVVAVKVVVVV